MLLGMHIHTCLYMHINGVWSVFILVSILGEQFQLLRFHPSFQQSTSDIAIISIKYYCNLQMFSQNCVKCISRYSRKIMYRAICKIPLVFVCFKKKKGLLYYITCKIYSASSFQA